MRASKSRAKSFRSQFFASSKRKKVSCRTAFGKLEKEKPLTD